MSRVAQLDSDILDNELHNLLVRDLNNVIVNDNDNDSSNNDRANMLTNLQNTDEWGLLCDTLIYLFMSHKSRNLITSKGSNIETYGTNLNGLVYKSPLRMALYLSNVLSKYLLSKLDKRFLLSNTGTTAFNFVIRYYRIILSIAELLNFSNFIVTGNYTSLLNRILKLRIVNNYTNNNSSLQFSNQNRLVSMDVQNRQLLWNAVLELLNVTILLPNSRYLFNSWQTKKSNNTQIITEDNICPYCNEPVSNPYIINCCNKIYCYWCVCKILEWKHCSSCNKTGNLQAKPLYQ